MEWETIQRLAWTVVAISFLMAAVGLLGELLGWWNDIGEMVITMGTIIGTLVALITLLTSSTRTQVVGIAAGVGTANQRLGSVSGKLDTANNKLDQIDLQLDKLEKLDKLDTIQASLDHQTGVMDRQVTLLSQIRDRL